MTVTSALDAPASVASSTTVGIDLRRPADDRPYDATSKSDLTTSLEPSQPHKQDASTLRDFTSQWWRKTSTSPIEAISGFQKWEGRVIEADADYFTVELTSLDDQDQPSAYADFETHLLEPDLVVPGDVVYITARMVEHGMGVPATKTVSVRLRRLGNWTAEQLDSVAEKSLAEWNELKDLFA